MSDVMPLGAGIALGALLTTDQVLGWPVAGVFVFGTVVTGIGGVLWGLRRLKDGGQDV